MLCSKKENIMITILAIGLIMVWTYNRFIEKRDYDKSEDNMKMAVVAAAAFLLVLSVFSKADGERVNKERKTITALYQMKAANPKESVAINKKIYRHKCKMYSAESSMRLYKKYQIYLTLFTW